MSYELTIPLPAAPSPRALKEALALSDLRGFPDDEETGSWDGPGFSLHREGLSTRTTGISWDGTELEIVVRALAAHEDCDLALRLVEAAASLTGATRLHADYFGDIDLVDLRRLHPAAWMDEQAASGTRALGHLIRDQKGPMEMPGPRRSCFIGVRLLGELEAAGPAESLPQRVVETLRRVQWDIPAGYREAGVFIPAEQKGASAEAKKPRPTRFAVWLPNDDLIIPNVDYVALRASEGDVVMVPFSVVPALAGTHGRPLDECQLLVRAFTPDEWQETVARARPFATVAKPR